MAPAWLLFATGGVLGLAGAVLGVGGGVLLVPALHLAFDMPLREAVGTSLVVVTGTAVTASAGYLERRLADVSTAMKLEVGALLGALVAAVAAPRVSLTLIARLFAIALLWAAVTLWWKRRRSDGGAPTAGAPRRLAAWSASSVAGGAAGLLGVGGGLVQVPILRLILGFDMRRSVATSTLTVGWTASIAAVVYWSRGDLDAGAVPWLLAGTLAGGAVAPAVAARLPLRSLEVAFSILLGYAALRMVGL